MFALNKYWLELQWRLFYIILCLCLCFTVVLQHINVFLLIEVYPLIKLGYSTLIATEITELFNSILQNSLFVSYISIFPVFSYHIHHFLITSFYVYQLKFFKLHLIYIFILWIALFLLSYTIFLPYLFKFFLQWEVTNNNVPFQLIINPRIHEYLLWINQFYNLLNSLLYLFTISFYFILIFCTIEFLFNLLQLYRKYLFFMVITLFYLITPPDFSLQINLLLLLLLFIESIFFFVCFRLKQQ